MEKYWDAPVRDKIIVNVSWVVSVTGNRNFITDIFVIAGQLIKSQSKKKMTALSSAGDREHRKVQYYIGRYKNN